VSKSVGPRPLGANKYPGGTQVNGAKKALTGGVGTAKSAVGGVKGGASKSLGGVTGGVVGGGQKALTGATSSLKDPVAKSGIASRPYPTAANARSNSLPKPYGNNSFPSSDKKTVVKPGQPKPFTPPVEQKKPGVDAGKKPYPGTNTIPGQGSRVPVQNQRLKPLPRLGPQIGQGQTMTHLAV
jgi:hypothetical protein